MEGLVSSNEADVLAHSPFRKCLGTPRGLRAALKSAHIAPQAQRNTARHIIAQPPPYDRLCPVGRAGDCGALGILCFPHPRSRPRQILRWQ